MANVSYPQYNLKTIVLPFDHVADDGISLANYKDKYGIDLVDLFKYNGSIFTEIPEDTLFLLKIDSYYVEDDSMQNSKSIYKPRVFISNDQTELCFFLNTLGIIDEDTSLAKLVSYQIVVNGSGLNVIRATKGVALS